MSNTPQLENGYVRIANTIVESMARTQFNGYEIRYLMVLLRKTYGFNKKSDVISNSQFVKETGLHKQHIWRTEKRLIERNIVTKNGYLLSFQKDTTRWRELPKQVTTKIVTNIGIPVTNSGAKVTKYGGHNIHTTKDTYTKDNNTLVEKITLWAYKRARVNPACTIDSFKRSVLVAIGRIGEEKVKKAYEQEDNAIQFLQNIKSL